MPKGTLTIHSENILPIIKKSLYSDKEIFIRELVSNASDALTKLQMISQQEGIELGTLRIDVSIDPLAKTLSISDSGIGMTSSEVETYLAQIAFSGAEEFSKKYTSSNSADQIIGHFGLGFYSAFMVSKEVDVYTQSYRLDEPSCHFSSDGSTTYQLDLIDKRERGTLVKLHVDEESLEFLDKTKLKEVLKKYCQFLPHSIFLEGELINGSTPLFLKTSSDCTKEEYLTFYRELYPFEPEPIFWIHVQIDYPIPVRGILYFPKMSSSIDFKKSTVKLFSQRVYVSDDIKEILPSYLMMLRGAIESADIPLNVSRSYLHMDKTIRQLGNHLSKKVSDRLVALLETDRDHYLSIYKEIELFLKIASIQEEKFYERAKSLLLFQTLKGEWLSLQNYLELYGEKSKKKVYYTIDPVESSFSNLYEQQGIGVIQSLSQIDHHFFSMVESKEEGVRFQRIDGGIDDLILDRDKHSAKDELLAFAKEQFKEMQVDIEVQPLQSKDLPAFVLIKEESRRYRDLLRLQETAPHTSLFDQKTLVLNSSSPLVLKIEEIAKEDPDLAKELLIEMYDLALLSQREFSHDQLSLFLKRSTHLLEKLLLRS